jgi:hypothetical protein
MKHLTLHKTLTKRVCTMPHAPSMARRITLGITITFIAACAMFYWANSLFDYEKP